MPRDTKGKPIKDDDMVHMEHKAKGDNMLGAGSKYPHGLRVHVDHEGLKKLDMDELPQVGHSVEMRAKAQVMGVHMDEGEDGQPRHRLEMQITHMGIHHKPDGMKSEDQGGSGKASAGHVTEKKGASGGDTKKESSTGKDAHYGRKRH